jgi:hypothetical protein
VGYGVYSISIVWLAYTLSGSFLVVGSVLFIEYAAYTLTFLVGPLVDRTHNQRSIFLACYPVQAVAAAVIGAGFIGGWLTTPLLLALVALISALWDLAWAAGHVTPGLILTPDQQFAAQGASAAIGGANSIGGYAVGGALILLVGAGGGLVLYAALLGMAAVFAVPLRVLSERRPSESLWQSFRAGWGALRVPTGRPLLQLAAADAIAASCLALPALLITRSAGVVGGSAPTEYGVLFTTYVVGGITASLLLGAVNPRASVGRLLGGALVATAMGFAAAAYLPASPGLATATWFSVGFTMGAYTDGKYAFLRGAVPPERLGRIVSNLYLFPGITSSAGALLLGGIAGAWSTAGLGTLAAAVFLLAGGLALFLPAVRSLRY